MNGYVQLKEDSPNRAQWHRRHAGVLCCCILSIGVVVFSQMHWTPMLQVQTAGKDQEEVVNVISTMRVDAGNGKQQYGRPPRFRVPTQGPATVAHAAGKAAIAASTAAVAAPTAPAAAPTAFGEISKDPRKKEGWGRKMGLSQPEYFSHIDSPGDLAQAPPFSLKELQQSVPKHLWEKNGWRSMGYFARDILQVVALGVAATKAAALMPAWAAAITVWPLYGILQGLVFWGLFCVGHDCGHQSFSKSKRLNDIVGNVVHSFILVPYHQWRISHRKHHSNHGHVENDESWTPISKSTYDELEEPVKAARFSCPVPLLLFPLYLFRGAPGKSGSHYDPDNTRLFQPSEKKLVIESNICNLSMVGILTLCTVKFGFLAVLKYYFAPWLVYVALLDAVTYLHHHGHHDESHPMPWYRGEEWSYLRGGLTCLDRDYGILNNLQHDIGTHVVHHLFPQMPHYNLVEATQHMKKVLGPYYRQPEPCPGPKLFGGYTNGGISLGLPTHLLGPLFRSFRDDRYVADEGNVLFYQAPHRPNSTKFSSERTTWLEHTCDA
eukprot:gnl/TRDRNA2_/TRDRNA2_83122_c0_seq1.p1 gnl/TRDRNA2_/TRDRNA2_83122_c0~~gnl/TRDRNA2_/TRDRNA2_83122_c0_seq1.p1  ORF type:complete len:549 (-),score=71.51 gnl/TRDRNA2_/TRDRNA2_83122_c0_seq1:69-1715(-)